MLVRSNAFALSSPCNLFSSLQIIMIDISDECAAENNEFEVASVEQPRAHVN